MVELLQRFSVINSQSLLWLFAAILAAWFVWPVLCGILGARRGQAASGVFHGLMWGPFGLLPVLLSRRRYPCPTCGKKTLPHAPGSAESPHQKFVIPPARPIAALEQSPRITLADDNHRPQTAAPAACATASIAPIAPEPHHAPPVPPSEAARLYQWINGEPAPQTARPCDPPPTRQCQNQT